MGRDRHPNAVLLIGLGRFGGTLAETLQRMGHDVVAVDANRVIVQEWSGTLTHVVEADATSEAALRQLGAEGFDRAVVAIGTGIEASLLAAGTLLDLGVPEVWAKAITRQHGRILERLGVSHVVYPERDAGERVAHLLSGRLLDFIEFDKGFAIAKLRAPRSVCGQTMAEALPRRRFGVTVVGVKRPDGEFGAVGSDTVVNQDDLIIVTGPTPEVERFAAATARPA
ncbi:TrkA family potassium uptake protein [Frankia sp. CNm7]|uniref:TrkA family potassium uptake protein n=1 Tax=Frankia nepalensis TaxID=1836974 RepID=A0A937RQB0_9ACTN|nr:TrkA family potassium uptake protein [Frankia nepalensis]MBL7501532.1 TrkA family potassium uptake protein [Frankia nepalensis]MBL7515303.1 TrkA family potassium uptake protein [Frankia nepalensis]MBL7523575.1 TrkA family potassium uptake protein [Frankia nepalensis]MBL7630026.1 TrkA family potassium uptake protein [Frankia nepalensis]